MKITNKPSDKIFAFVNFSVTSKKEMNRENNETMPLWFSMRLCVDVCAMNNSQSRYGNFATLKNKY